MKNKSLMLNETEERVRVERLDDKVKAAEKWEEVSLQTRVLKQRCMFPLNTDIQYLRCLK